MRVVPEHADKMIAQGRGNERPSDYRKKDDELSKQSNELLDGYGEAILNKKARTVLYEAAGLTIKKAAKHDAVYTKAKKAGCTPKWYDGILGWTWHCGCAGDSEAHFIDQQCSAVKWYKGA